MRSRHLYGQHRNAVFQLARANPRLRRCVEKLYEARRLRRGYIRLQRRCTRSEKMRMNTSSAGRRSAQFGTTPRTMSRVAQPGLDCCRRGHCAIVERLHEAAGSGREISHAPTTAVADQVDCRQFRRTVRVDVVRADRGHPFDRPDGFEPETSTPGVTSLPNVRSPLPK